MARVHFCGVREIFSVGLSNMAWVYQLAGTGRAAEEQRRGSSSNAADELDGPKSLADSVRRDRRIAARTSGTPGAGQKGAAAPRASVGNPRCAVGAAPRAVSRERCPQAAAMAGARGAAAAVAVLAAALLVAAGADASGDSLADLGGAAREIESAPGNRPVHRRRSPSGPAVTVCARSSHEGGSG